MKNNVNWLNKFQQLLEYKKEYGDCNVPSTHDKNQSLSYWVQTQRTTYKQSKLSDEQINMLHSIGFEWNLPSNDDFWFNRFEQLKQYKFKNGDCNMPTIYVENRTLANWVNTQRIRYKQVKMSKERMHMLNSIGFEWTSPQDKIWHDHFKELKLYKSKHGDSNVKWDDKQNQHLFYWVQRQRSQYKKSKLSEERINFLNDIGFDWTVPHNSRDALIIDASIRWHNKFEDIKKYKSKYGDCNVPGVYEENQQLANWVQRQCRRCYSSKLKEHSI